MGRQKQDSNYHCRFNWRTQKNQGNCPKNEDPLEVGHQRRRWRQFSDTFLRQVWRWPWHCLKNARQNAGNQKHGHHSLRYSLPLRIWTSWIIRFRKSRFDCKTMHGNWKIIRTWDEHYGHWRRFPLRRPFGKDHQCPEDYWKGPSWIQGACWARKTLQRKLFLSFDKSFGKETEEWKALLSLELIPLSQFQLQPDGWSEFWEQRESILLKNWLWEFGTKWNLRNT